MVLDAIGWYWMGLDGTGSLLEPSVSCSGCLNLDEFMNWLSALSAQGSPPLSRRSVVRWGVLFKAVWLPPSRQLEVLVLQLSVSFGLGVHITVSSDGGQS